MGVLGEVLAERRRQHLLRGVQDYGDLDPADSSACTPAALAVRCGIPTATAGRTACETVHRSEVGTWAHILVEEVAEVV